MFEILVSTAFTNLRFVFFLKTVQAADTSYVLSTAELELSATVVSLSLSCVRVCVFIAILCVRPSVTIRHCIKTAEYIVENYFTI